MPATVKAVGLNRMFLEGGPPHERRRERKQARIQKLDEIGREVRERKATGALEPGKKSTRGKDE